MMKVEQFVMAYGVEQDRLRAILPDGFMSLRPVLRVNAEVRDERTGYVEFNTAVEKDGVRGWLNIGYWDAVPFTREGKTVTFRTELLEIRFTGVGIEGSCPAEKATFDGCTFNNYTNATYANNSNPIAGGHCQRQGVLRLYVPLEAGRRCARRQHRKNAARLSDGGQRCVPEGGFHR